MKVLLVDDAAVVRARLKAMLAEVVGVDVVAVEGSYQAFHALAHGLPDVVVLDLQLRGESGMALTPEFKRLCPAALLVILTNHADRHHRRQCLALGADHFLDKSTDFAELLRIVEERASVLRATA